jgi:hypothetical protein
MAGVTMGRKIRVFSRNSSHALGTKRNPLALKNDSNGHSALLFRFLSQK